MADNKNINPTNIESTKQLHSRLQKTNISNVLSEYITSSRKPDFNTVLTQASNNSDKDGTDLAYRKAAQEFEKQFFASMWSIMAETVEVDPLFGGGLGEEVLRSVLISNQVHEAYASKESYIFKYKYKALKREEELNDRKSIKQRTREESG